MTKPLWNQAAQLQKAKDNWIDGQLSLSQDAISFKGQEEILIMISSLTGEQSCISTFVIVSSNTSRSMIISAGPGIQKAKGQPILRVVAGKASRVFRFASLDAREAFLDVISPLKDAHAASQPSVVPKKSIQEAVLSTHKDVAALYQRYEPTYPVLSCI